MSSTFLEGLLHRRGDETEVPDGDFRNAMLDVVAFLKEYRGSTLEFNDSEYDIDNLLPDCESIFVAIAKVVDYWFRKFPAYSLFSFQDNFLKLDDFSNALYPFLRIEGEPPQPTPSMPEAPEVRYYSPYFYELGRAAAPIDDEVRGIIQVLADGDYPRYTNFGVGLFLLDLAWWGWQSFLGEPDGRGEGDISFMVTQPVGLSNYSFTCTFDKPREVISLEQPVDNSYQFRVKDLAIVDTTDLEVFEGESELFTTGGPNKIIAFNLDLTGLDENLNITDIILQCWPDSRTSHSVIYSCNPKPNSNIPEYPLGVMGATLVDGEFTFSDTLLNDLSLPNGVNFTLDCGEGLGLLLETEDYETEPRYLIEIYSDLELIVYHNIFGQI